jgi:hypothetical protein
MDQQDNQNPQSNSVPTDTTNLNSTSPNPNPQSPDMENSQPTSYTPPSQPQPTNDQFVENTSDNQQSEEDYILNVGQSMIDLLTDISNSDVRKQKIATEMRISVEQVTTICDRLLEKIDSGELTEEDLAFLITAPIADTDPTE